MHIKLKKGDKVIVISGKSKGSTGTIAQAFPAKDLVVIDGVNMVKRHRRPSAPNRSGQIVEKPMPLHASNVMLVDPKTGKPTPIKIVRTEGKRERVAAKNGQNVK